MVERIDDEIVVFNIETKGAHCLRPLAAFVFENADGEVSAGELAARATQQLGTPVSVDEISDAVAQLRDCSLMDEPLVLVNGMPRREALKRFAYAGAAATAATTLVTSIVAPTPAMASTVIPVGCPGCGQNHQCATAPGCPGGSGHCCTNANQTCTALLTCCVDCNNSCKVATVGTTVACSVCLPFSFNCPTSCPGGARPCPCFQSNACP